MNKRILAVALAVMAASILLMNGQQAQAGIQPVLTVDHVFTALNSGDVDAAAASFAEGAVVENLLSNETYVGSDEIRQVLLLYSRETRQFDIVRVDMVGDMITMDVEISDRGIVWGTETFTAEVRDGKLKTLQTTRFRLRF